MDRPPWLVSIHHSRDGRAEGSGFLLPDGRVITCAHVLPEPEAGSEPVPDQAPAAPPVGPESFPSVPSVFVRFQWAGSREPVPASVAPGGWHPDPENTLRGDIAVLELAVPAPAGAVPAPVRTAGDLIFNREVRAYGYPRGHEQGAVPARGVVDGGAHDEWLGLHSPDGQGHPMGPGFSGAPLWDEQWGAVIGMVVARDRPSADAPDQRTAYAIPAEVLAGYWPPLRDHLSEVRPGPREREGLEAALALPLGRDGRLPRVDEVDIYDLGVSPSKYVTTENPSPPYLPRSEIDTRLAHALSTEPFVLVIGPSKSGKSRSLIVALRRELGAARLVVPRSDPPGLAALARSPLLSGAQRTVIWLEDLGGYMNPHGLDLKVLEQLAQRQPGITVAATMTSRSYHDFVSTTGDTNKTARSVLSRAHLIRLDTALSPAERRKAAELYPEEDFTERGIGEVMVAAPLLEARYDIAAEVQPHGWAVLCAAVDWRRMGLEKIEPAELRDSYRHYLAMARPDLDDTDDNFAAGLSWALAPVAGSVALLHRLGTGAERDYRAFDYIVALADGQDNRPPRPIPEFAWARAVDTVPPDQLLNVAITAYTRDDGRMARLAARRAYAEGDDPEIVAWAGVLAGELALAADDTEEARRLFESVGAGPSEAVAAMARMSLGALLAREGDWARAEAVLTEVIESADPHTAVEAKAHLGQAILGRAERKQALWSDAAGTFAATGVADATTTGSADGLAGRLRADLAVPLAQTNLGSLLMTRGELTRARELLESARDSGIAEVQQLVDANLGALLLQQGETERGQRLLRAASESADRELAAMAKVTLAVNLGQAGDHARAEELLREVADSGLREHAARAADLLGDLLASLDDHPGARAAYQRAIESGDRTWAPIAVIDLAQLLGRTGDVAGATRLLRELGTSPDVELALRGTDLLGDLLAEHGDPTGAAAAYQQVIDAGHDEWSAIARIDLALLVIDDDDVQAERLLTEAARAPDRHITCLANYWLGLLRLHRGQAAEARENLLLATEIPVAEVAAVAWYHLGRIAADEGDPVRAVESLERALTLGEGDDELAEIVALARAHLNRLLLRRGDRQEIDRLFTVALDSGRPNVRGSALLMQGQYLLDQGDVPAAVDLLDAAVREVDDELRPAAQVSLGVARLAAGDLAQAQQLLTPGLEARDPFVRATARRYLGSVLARTGRPVEAADLLLPLATAEGDPHRGEAAMLLGQIALDDGRTAEARSWFIAALDSGDQDVREQARHALGVRGSGPALRAVPGERGMVAQAAQGSAGSAGPVEPADQAGAAGPAGTAGAADHVRVTDQAGPADQTVPGSAAGPPPGLAVLLGEVAAAEGASEEARHWLALAAAGADEGVRARAAARLALLDTLAARSAPVMAAPSPDSAR